MSNVYSFEIKKLKTVDSTQSYAKRLIHKYKIIPHTVIIANNQTEGHGSKGRKWISKDGNAFFTIVIDMLDDSTNTQISYSKYKLSKIKSNSQISYIGAVAIGEACASLNLNNAVISYKWVNDILLNDKKIAGILCEIFMNRFLLMGVGINILHAPSKNELTQCCSNNNRHYTATSFDLEGIAIDKDNFIDTIIEYIRIYYNHWNLSGFDYIKNLWLKKAAYINKNILIKTPKGFEEGKFLSIDENGDMLILTKENGFREMYDLGGEISGYQEKVITLRSGEIQI